ncbi:MAG: phosphoadenosine phosphosulfate reductase family protein [Pyrodictiaceae archaeon]
MTELYPLIEDRILRGVMGSGGDATKICKVSGGCSHYLWLNKQEAVSVDSLMDEKGKVWVEDESKKLPVPIRSWLLAVPYIHARVVDNLEEYVEWLKKRVGRELKGKRILLGFSGGKDSLAALIVVAKLAEHIPVKIHPIYIHIPFLESPRSIRFVEKVSKKLSIEIDIREAPKRIIKSMLKWRGMPRRGFRWCTVYKVKFMREVKKNDPKTIEVVADRLPESPKRFERLSKAAAHRILFVGRKFRPTYMLAVLDVISIVKKYGLVHPDYLDGLPRVACHLCPFKTLYEFRKLPELEDPGLIDEVLRRTWMRWYEFVSYEEFVEQHLWRFDRFTAKALSKLRKELGRTSQGYIKAKWLEEAHKRIWLEDIEAPRVSDPWLIPEYLSRGWRRGDQIILVS